jgi:hypothetical protein
MKAILSFTQGDATHYYDVEVVEPLPTNEQFSPTHPLCTMKKLADAKSLREPILLAIVVEAIVVEAHHIVPIATEVAA